MKIKGEFREVFIGLVRSHKKLSSAEYHRNPLYNAEHFSHIAETKLIEYLLSNDRELLDELTKSQ